MSEHSCPVPVRSELASAARPKICGLPATVRTLAPMRSGKGEEFYAPALLCLKHSCDIAVFKMINGLKKRETPSAWKQKFDKTGQNKGISRNSR